MKPALMACVRWAAITFIGVCAFDRARDYNACEIATGVLVLLSAGALLAALGHCLQACRAEFTESADEPTTQQLIDR